jgi:hypothetical protein
LSCRQEVLIEDTPDLDLQDGILLARADSLMGSRRFATWA